MKKLIFNLILSLIIVALTGCKLDNSPAPLKFKGYENNPVLVPGVPGRWDDLYVINAFVLEDNDTIYLFYTAYSQTGSRALGLATSTDGYHFTKFKGNPILTGDKKGYDAFGVAQAQVLKEDSLWVLYFNGREIAGFSSGPSIGRATAKSLTGHWTKSEEPVLTSGRRGEWDSDFIYLGQVLKMGDGSYIMYYSGGQDILIANDWFIGMATSKDGNNWKKYNDPATSQHPFAESDPVMMTGKAGDWDAELLLSCAVLKLPEGYGMYYSCGAFGYATSMDGIHWDKYRKNPFYTLVDDPYWYKMVKKDAALQGAKLLFRNTLCFMYYDYAHGENSAISMAIAQVKKGEGIWQ
jgi:predicted GH43/DUF377 family glycosyl hydrolase